MAAPSTRIAVLIDADNTSPKHASDLLEELASYGVATVKRAYGDWTGPQLGGWKSELNKHAIVPVQQFAYTTGKNSTDSMLIIDAMDLLYSGNLDAFALVSSDSDFTRLATRLRESGKTVYGLGLRKTPESLVAACDKFIYLEVIGQAGESGGGTAATDANAGDGQRSAASLKRLLTRAVDSKSQEDGWAHLGAIGQYLSSADAAFDPRNFGHAKLSSLLQAQDYLDVENADGTARVRRRPSRPAKKAAKKAVKKAPAK